MTNTVKSCNTVNLLDKATYDQQTPSDTELWAVDEESDATYKGMVAGWAMPSTSYEDLTLGASGSTYTAPANGWFVVIKQANGSGQYLNLKGDSIEVRTSVGNSSETLASIIPVKKDEVVTVKYNLSGQTWGFRFVYAEGEV